MKKILIGVVSCLIVGVFALTLWFQLRLPAVSGDVKTAAVSDATHIYRDAHGIPHIFAKSLNDGYAALGYLHASDRLFQMEMMRRAGTGRLAQVLGKDLINYDKKMRALGFYKMIEPYFARLSPEAKTAMQAYASGVNAYLKKAALPAEFTLLGFKPAPWQAHDGLIWAKMMALQLSGNWEDEVLREQLLQKGWSREQVNTLYPVADANVPVTVAPLQWVRTRPKAQGVRPEEEKVPVALDFFPNTSGLGPQTSSGASFFERLPHTASNAYVIAGAHTKSGKPILANDPHLQLQSPVLWYLARIVTPEFELKGATAPGMPFFPLGQSGGQNGNVAWGFTTSNMDVQDITFIDATEKMSRRDEIIHVKDAPDVTFSVEANKTGVVLSDIVADITAITPPHKKALLQFTGFDEGDKTAQALYAMNNAGNAAAVEAALDDYSVPPQNLVYADKDGHVGYRAVGMVPKRSKDGFFARDNQRWQGVINAAAPQLKDPAAGVIMTANNAVIGNEGCKKFSCAFARDWAEPYRAMRLETLFNDAFVAHTQFDVQSASAPMLDITSMAAKRFLPVMLKAMPGDDAMIAALRNWDGSMQRDKPEPLIFHAWLDALMQKTFGQNYTSDVMWPRMWALQAQMISDDVLRSSFANAMDELKQRHGADSQHWRWGDEHGAPLKHPVWSHVPLIKDLVSLRTQTDGDGYTLRRAQPGNYAHPFEVEHGAGYRGVYDLADPAQSLFVIATGQSGQIFSKHYSDLRDAWNRGAFVTMQGDEQMLRSKGARVLTLSPQ